MAEFNVLQKDGEWFTNRALFRFVDPTNGNFFEPGVPTKATNTDWVKSQGQGLLQSCKDPLSDDFEPVAPVTDNTVKPDSTLADAEAATAAATTNGKKR